MHLLLVIVQTKIICYVKPYLKYADIDDIHNLFTLYGEAKVREVWEQSVKSDSRFKRLNYFIARVFFHLDVEGSGFENLQSMRLNIFLKTN